MEPLHAAGLVKTRLEHPGKDAMEVVVFTLLFYSRDEFSFSIRELTTLSLLDLYVTKTRPYGLPAGRRLNYYFDSGSRDRTLLILRGQAVWNTGITSAKLVVTN